jgi:putative DNA primase/helicase
MDDAQKRRLNVIPFEIIIPEGERDKTLKEKLEKEWPGILAWAVRGCLEWQRIGLSMPPDVIQANREYAMEMDMIGRFVNEYCIIEKEAGVTAGNFLKALNVWGRENGEGDFNNKMVKDWFFGKKEFRRRKGAPVKYSGIGLKSGQES